MARFCNHGYYGDPPWCMYCPQPYYGAAPVTFREPPFYDLRDYRHIRHPPPEQVLVWEEDERTGAGAWRWRNSEFIYGGHNGHRIFVAEPDYYQHCELEQDRVEFYVPLCCYNCEHRVKNYLQYLPGVQRVTADQWEKKVVVVGCNLRPHDLLRSLRRHLSKLYSTFWEHRPR